MLSSVVGGVHSDSVDAKFGEFLKVTLATVGISEGVLRVGSATGLIVNTTNEETSTVRKDEGFA